MGIRLVVVGGGRMGEALLGGLLAGAWAEPGELGVVEARAERREELCQRFPGVAVEATPVAAEGVVLAVKPGDVVDSAEAVAAAGYHRVLSIAAGVTLATLEGALSAESGARAVVRAMPNTPALVGAGAAAVAGGSFAGEDDLVWAEGLLGALGTVVRVSEGLLDAVTALSGSGPAYVFLVAEALIDAGVTVGLTREVSTALAIQTLYGSARLLAETGESPASLRAGVTSPGGTTAAGLRVLESAGLRSAILEAVVAAADRARALGQG